MKHKVSLTLTKKLAIGFGAVLALFVAAAAFNVVQVQSIKSQLVAQNGKTGNELTAFELKAMTQELKDLSSGLMISRDMAYADKVKDKRTQYEALLQKIQDTASTPQQIAWRSKLVISSVEFLDTFDRAATIIGDKTLKDADIRVNTAALYRQSQEQRDIIFDVVDKFYADYSHDASAAVDKTYRLTDRIVIMLSAAAVIVLLAAIAVSLLLSRSITRPIKRLQSAVERLAAGDFRFAIEATGGDELSVLSHRFDDMVGRVRGMLAGVRDIVGLLSAHAGSFQTFAKDTAAANADIVRTIDGIAVGAGEQAVRAEQSAGLIDELNEQLAVITALAGRMHDDGKTAGERSESGAAQMAALQQSTRETVDMVTHMTEAMRMLETGSAQIGGIVAAITDIAGQTNVLALNASIEASRSGAAGKGFSVIAAEVRRLSTQTGESSKRIGAIVAGLQTQIRELGERMEHARDGLRRQSGQVDESLASFAAIREAVGGMIERFGRMHEQIEAAKAQNDELIEASRFVAAVAQQTAAGVQEVNSTSIEQDASIRRIAEQADGIGDLAGRLAEQLGRFRTEEGESETTAEETTAAGDGAERSAPAGPTAA